MMPVDDTYVENAWKHAEMDEIENLAAELLGVQGEMEHGGACCRPMLGKPMRAAVGGGKALIASNVKVAPGLYGISYRSSGIAQITGR